jgi:membrane protease YdiL (CAAX protease family)
MNRALKLLVLIDLVFIFILSLSGSLGGISGTVLYLAAFIIPTAFAILSLKSTDSGTNVKNEVLNRLKLEKSKLTFTLPLSAPIILAVILVSLLTTALFSSFGLEAPTVENESLPVMILRHALLPAALEEMLFRFVPMLLLSRHSKRSCVLYSSLFFALIHCNLFQIPYAFLAGALFMTVNLATDSFIPSLILHFLNNTLSLISLKYCKDEASLLIYLAIVGILALVSLIFILRKRREYSTAITGALSGRLEVKYLSPLALIIPTLIISVVNLI